MREIKLYPIVDKLINMFDNWLKHRQEISEMREFDAGELPGFSGRTMAFPP